MQTLLRKSLIIATVLSVAVPVFAQQAEPQMKHQDTEVYAPVPPTVTPGKTDADPPSDAIILFDGKDEDQWVSAQDHTPARWTVADDTLKVSKEKGVGNIETKKTFKDYQLHIEWKIPTTIEGSDQARGNSGVFLASTGPKDDGYELQVLDNYNNKTYVNGQAGAIYKQAIPLASPARKPGEWQSYDIIFHAPRFDADGKLEKPGTVTVLQNGILVQDNVEIKGNTGPTGAPKYRAHPLKQSLLLQDHHNPVRYRNIWIREL